MIDERMIARVAQYAVANAPGEAQSTTVPSLTIYSAARPADLMPSLFEPRFYVLLQGAKRLAIAGQDLLVRPGDCAISTLGLPFYTQVVEASRERPYLGVAVALDPTQIADILLADPDAFEDEPEAPAFAAGRLTEEIADRLDRLLRLLESPGDIPVVAPLVERELWYRLIRGTMGGTIRKVAPSYARFAQISAAAEWIRTHANEPMRVDDVADRVGMSVTSLHRHFRTVTGTSPLAYQRHIRLLDARRTIMADGLGITTAAFASGYASASQFSREYKHMFGVAPATDRMMATQKA